MSDIDLVYVSKSTPSDFSGLEISHMQTASPALVGQFRISPWILHIRRDQMGVYENRETPWKKETRPKAIGLGSPYYQ